MLDACRTTGVLVLGKVYGCESYPAHPRRTRRAAAWPEERKSAPAVTRCSLCARSLHRPIFEALPRSRTIWSFILDGADDLHTNAANIAAGLCKAGSKLPCAVAVHGRSLVVLAIVVVS